MWLALDLRPFIGVASVSMLEITESYVELRAQTRFQL